MPLCHLNQNVLIKIQTFSTYLATFNYYLKSFNAERLYQSMTSEPIEISDLTSILPFQPFQIFLGRRDSQTFAKKG